MTRATTAYLTRAGAMCALVAGVLLLAACERPPVDMVQRGFRGTGMDQVYNPRTIARQASVNVAPEDSPAADANGPKASAVFKNVKVAGDLSVGEFTRLMASMTAWVAPAQGCAYCHKAGEDFSSDSLYTKVVARRMLEMTRHINADWSNHVAATGVTCYTCHRGQPVPAKVWSMPVPQKQASGMVGDNAGQNVAAESVAWTALPYDPYTPYLSQAADVRIMMHMSQALGVNCTYCHNSRSFADWEGSTPQRVTAWHGIRMARDINTQYMDGLTRVFPANRLGPMGDVLKVNCDTCHQGAYKPLYGAGLLKNHPELKGKKAAAQAPSPAAVAAAPAK